MMTSVLGGLEERFIYLCSISICIPEKLCSVNDSSGKTNSVHVAIPSHKILFPGPLVLDEYTKFIPLLSWGSTATLGQTPRRYLLISSSFRRREGTCYLSIASYAAVNHSI